MSRIALAWDVAHSRTDSLAQALGLRAVYVWHMGRVPLGVVPAKYLWQTADTLSLLLRERPTALLVQTPPVFPAVLACLYAAIGGARVVLDAHSSSFVSTRWRWSLPLHRWCSRRAELTLVHVPALARLVACWQARVLVLDNFRIEQDVAPCPADDVFTVAVPCSFNADEPIEAILQAAARLPHIRFQLTGDYRRLPQAWRERQPPNVRFTGFLPVRAYRELIGRAHVVMALTTDPDTQQNAGVEAIWLGAPFLTSDWPALRQVYRQGTVFVDNTPEGIAAGITAARATQAALRRSVPLQRALFDQAWVAKCQQVRKALGSSA